MYNNIYVLGCVALGSSRWQRVRSLGWCNSVSVARLWEPRIAFPYTDTTPSTVPIRIKQTVKCHQLSQYTSCQQPTEISTEVSHLPAVQPRHNPWGKALQTLCTLWLCCQGCHTLGQKHAWKSSNRLKHTRPSAENNYSSVSNCSAWAGIQMDHESSVKALSLAFLGGSDVMLALHLSKSRARMWSAHFLHFHQGSSGLSSSSTWSVSCKATHTSILEDQSDKTEHSILLKKVCEIEQTFQTVVLHT